MRTNHLVSYRLRTGEGDFLLKVETGALQKDLNKDAACGFLVGAGPEMDVLGASLVQQKPGPGAGLFAGITAAGDLFVKDMESGKDLKRIQAELSDRNVLQVESLKENEEYTIILKCQM